MYTGYILIGSNNIMANIQQYSFYILTILFVIYLVYTLSRTVDNSLSVFDKILNRRLYLQYFSDQYRGMKMLPVDKKDYDRKLSEFYILGSNKSYRLNPTVVDYDGVIYAIRSGARVIHIDMNDIGPLSLKRILQHIYTESWKRCDYPMIVYVIGNDVGAIQEAVMQQHDRLYSGPDEINNITYRQARGKLLLFVNDSIGKRRPAGTVGTIGAIDNSNEVVDNGSTVMVKYTKAIDTALHATTVVNPNDVYIRNGISYIGYYGNNTNIVPVSKFSFIFPEDGVEQLDVKTGIIYRINCIMMNMQTYDTQMALALDTFSERSFVVKKSI